MKITPQKENNEQLSSSRSLFINDLVKIVIFQVIYQFVYLILMYLFPIRDDLTAISFFNISIYFFIFLIIRQTIKYTIANKSLIYLFLFEFLFLAVFFLILPFSMNQKYTFYVDLLVVVPFLSLLITVFLFFYSVSPKMAIFKMLVLTFLFSLFLTYIINIDINPFQTYDKLPTDLLTNLMRNGYYINLINLSFLIFIWFTYLQGHFILSEYLPAVLGIHTLMIMIEIYQNYTYLNSLKYYVDGQYFSAIVNISFVLVWLIRLKYLTKPESKKNEKYVLNYDILKDFVVKPHKNAIDLAVRKLGKQKLILVSLFLFLVISIPLLFFGEFGYFKRLNSLVILIFLLAVITYGIINTQRKWYHHIGFLLHRTDKKQ